MPVFLYIHSVHQNGTGTRVVKAGNPTGRRSFSASGGSRGGSLYIYKASMATVHLMEGTGNTLADGTVCTFDDEYSSPADEEPNAGLVIEGAGALSVTANFDNGITSKDTLQIHDGVLSVQAVSNGKDSNVIDSAPISVTCGGDAIRSTNDADETPGWISISSSTLDLTAGEDGIQAETDHV